jgi:predicted RNA binding protein YcfA (HicA-like mRNA interferase family)
VAKTCSGQEAVKILSREFGFFFVSQKGSHVKLRKRLATRVVTTIIPLHKDLAHGTLRGILELAEVDEKEFSDWL